ncbi:Txe/YoeB family addiction module toxin [Nocardia bovistercoris]|uniref:Endoribonuclease YoeB n=1 Tax=Nocardia bovistercoris TaxID=2785916 RepID=A0A931IHU4_9NOCA|nr:Txe/YoeB family addiction module toxin [Nocardia bovistercoris]MBH0779980.1 Txe/YoeB family addiction module toxin [Nocardia bovistercoris]
MPDRKLTFTAQGWRSYSAWLARDRAVLKAANKLIDAALTDPFDGVGKPEPLRHQLAGHWSRRITQEHRLIYYVTDSEIAIVQVGGHYGY